VQQAGPAVVGVTVAGLRKGEAEDLPLKFSDPFFQFFQNLPGFQFRLPGANGVPDVPFRSQGSGFIISSDGLILTNAHVVREASEVVVKLSDRREFKARVLGADPATDIAVLRIDTQNLPVVRLGDARQLQVGDPVLAIGSPFGFEQTATQGIVSAKGRSLPGDAAVPFIQTDAAVNPGSSGGPLFDASGAVVGINAQIYSQSGGYQGLSFAIPINVALKVKDQIVATGRAAHAWLGVTVQDLNQALAESFGLSHPDGALVASVAPDSAAAKAGVRAGDVLTSFNGEPITRSGDLSSRIGQASPGETVRLGVWRDKKLQELSVKLGTVREPGRQPKPREEASSADQFGLRLRTLTREEQSQTGITGGLLIEGVSGPAARAGLVPGDLLLAINGVPVSSANQVQGLLAQKPGHKALLIQRQGERLFVPVELG
jgi:serine protease Do